MTLSPVEPARYPLSFGQEQLWFLEQLTPGTPTYNVAILYRVTGPLDHAALRQSVRWVIDRHEILRARFGADEGVPYQEVMPAPHDPLTMTDLRSADQQDRERMAVSAAETDATTAFDLVTGPLFRFHLYQVGDEEHLWSIVIHHIVCDGWSVNLVNEEIAASYAALTTNGALPDAPVEIRYRDFVAAQRESQQAGVFDASLMFWKKQLAGLPVLEFPADKPRPALAGHDGAHLRVEWPQLGPAVASVAAARGCSLSMLLTAAFGVVLNRYTREEDIAIGTTALGRIEPEWEHVVGLFVNVVVLRLDMSADPTFTMLLERVRETTLDALDNQAVPFERVVDGAGIPRDPSRNPLFQMLVQVQDRNTGNSPISLPGVSITVVDRPPNRSRFDMSLTFEESGESIALAAEYSTELFDRWRMEQLFEHIRRVLTAVCRDPDIRLSAIDLLSEEDRSEILAYGHGAEEELRTDPAHVLVAEHAAATPDAVAIVFEGTEVTYGELSRRADALAGWLRLTLGVRHEEYVAVALNRGPTVVTAFLGVSKAGGAYVVLDVDHPRNRLEFILDDASVRIVLTTSDLLDRLPDPGDRTYVCLDRQWDAIEADRAGRPDAVLPEVSTGDSLVNLLYTSGTTGRPKGVPTEHRALASYLVPFVRTYGLGPGDRVLQFANLAFDLCQAEMFATLTSGATLVCARTDTLHTPEALSSLIRDERLTYVGAPPTMLAMVEPEDYPDLRYLFVGGEACPAEIANRWNLPGRLFINGYGPTEAAIGATMHPVPHVRYRSSPPIGGPLPHRRLYVVDPATDALLPIGVPGELLIGGDEGLARGYLNQPDLTARKFVPDPFRDTGRVYRTGDLARWNPEGHLEFLGRIDTQVKLRGLRIELEEIETVLLAHPSVRQAAVTLAEDLRGEKILAAYVVLVPGQSLDVPGLRRHLAEYVPAFMIPSAWTVLTALPVSSTGKLSRAALPAPVSYDDAARRIIAAETPAERYVADTFTELLGLPAGRVGADDDFFELGGNSLQAMRVISRVNKKFAIRLGVRSLYGAPNLREFAGQIDDAMTKSPAGRGDTTPRTDDAADVVAAGSTADIASILAEVLSRSAQVGVDDNLFELGGDDADAAELLRLIDQRCAVALTERDLYTPSALAAAVAGRRARERWSPLVTFTDRAGRHAPLFCLPGAAGSASTFAGLARRLTSDRPVIGLEAPGLEDGREPLNRVADLAEEFLTAIRKRQPDGPYHLLGWSMGGLVAHEIARLLYTAGQTVAFLALVDTALLAGRPVPDDRALTEQFVADLAAEAGRHRPTGPLPIGDDRFDEFFALLRDTVLPAEIGPDQLRRRVAAYRAGSAAAFTCRPTWVYPGRLDVIRAADGSSPNRADWANLASQVREYRTPGDHISLWSAENRPALAIMIDTLLGTVEG